MIKLNYKEARPLYEQIKESIRKMVISNAFLADEKLPSVREMASQLAVNPNAIERAYQELEQDGYVYRRKDEGTFVAKENRVNEMRRRELMQKFDLVVRELSELSVSSNELAERVEVITKGDKTF
ncbi:MAG: GntR family transcriptional regulator [Lachnobacterium sp.]|nr:GntR family transcriptional regulator [Lachnobacterium sp.]